ncbi:hypothetical protein D5S17_16095 [Pseudonocardiaceae bacterium YIM PH 21723]|nr:hypothetical protein D5S17_16095 [Pseudonocardiaceae bacterium YIM PH 21723]
MFAPGVGVVLLYLLVICNQYSAKLLIEFLGADRDGTQLARSLFSFRWFLPGVADMPEPVVIYCDLVAVLFAVLAALFLRRVGLHPGKSGFELFLTAFGATMAAAIGAVLAGSLLSQVLQLGLKASLIEQFLSSAGAGILISFIVGGVVVQTVKSEAGPSTALFGNPRPPRAGNGPLSL